MICIRYFWCASCALPILPLGYELRRDEDTKITLVTRANVRIRKRQLLVELFLEHLDDHTWKRNGLECAEVIVAMR